MIEVVERRRRRRTEDKLKVLMEPGASIAAVADWHDPAKTRAHELSRHVRKKVDMLFAHLKRILRLNRLLLRGPAGPQFKFTLAAIAQYLRCPARCVGWS